MANKDRSRKIEQAINLLKLVLSLDDEEIMRAAIESVIDILGDIKNNAS